MGRPVAGAIGGYRERIVQAIRSYRDVAATEGNGFDLSRPVMTTDRRIGVKSYSVLVSFGQIYSDEPARRK